MPFRSLLPSGNNDSSSSRKRSYAETNGSDSRSQSPQHTSSKRRRTGPTASISSNLTRTRTSSPCSVTFHHDSTSERYPPLSADHQFASEEYQPWPERGRYDPVTERYEGDGLDFRRPVMSTSTATQTVDRTFIDLTEDDSQPEATEEPFTTRNRRRTEEERWNEAAEIRRSSSRRGDERNERRRLRNVERQQTLARIQYARDHGPRFGRDIIGEEVDDLEVIDLLDSDDTGEVEAEAEAEAEPDLDMGEDLFGDLIDSSPELTFLSERPVPLEGGTRVPSRNNHRRLPTPQNIRRGILPNTFQNLREFVRQGTFGYRGLSENEIDDAREAMDRETLDRIDGIREARPRQRIRELGPFGEIAMFPPRQPSLGRPEVIDMDELELNLDYEAAAFQVGDPDQPEIIEPHVWQGMMGGRGDTPIELEKEAYTRPKTPANGFTMNMAEDDVLACPSCHDELAVGVEGSAKQQVWMIKSCGHVYCGECAKHRAISKQKKEKGKAVQKAAMPFKKCLVVDCGKAVTAKGAMFQVYL